MTWTALLFSLVLVIWPCSQGSETNISTVELDEAVEELFHLSRDNDHLRSRMAELESLLQTAMQKNQELHAKLHMCLCEKESAVCSDTSGSGSQEAILANTSRTGRKRELSKFRLTRWAEGKNTPADGGPWKANPKEWDNLMFQVYTEAVASATALNAAMDLQRAPKGTAEVNLADVQFAKRVQEVNGAVGVLGVGPEGSHDFTGDRNTISDIPIPVFLLNLEHRSDRREHMLQLLRAVGFSNVSVHKAISWQDLDWSTLVAEGKVNGTSPGKFSIAGIHRRAGEAVARKFSANALNHFEMHSQAIREQLPLYAIMEDDLMPASSLAEVNRRIVQALDAWPADGDTLYLELCFERCDDARFSAAHAGLVRAANPHCTAGVVYRQRAAQKIVQRIRPAFMSIDGMLAGMVSEHALRAYAAMPLPFFQDAFFGSDVAERRAAPRHVVSGIVCNHQEEFLVEDVELRFAGVVRDGAEEEGGQGGVELVAMARGGMHEKHWGRAAAGEAVRYYTRSRASLAFREEAMACMGGEEERECRWELRITEKSACFGSATACEVEMVREGEDGAELGAVRKVLLLQRKRLGTPGPSPWD